MKKGAEQAGEKMGKSIPLTEISV